ncbi:MAG: hypothetical protein RIQ93_1583, partial [Verrucomicrobiota bacterium]|jgi:putative heme-binding domain-containing protein
MAREHSETINIPADVEKHLDLMSGQDRGRIYRIAPAGFRSPPPPRLSGAAGAALVAALSSPHGWWRDTAHRLIFERQDKSLVPALENLATAAASPQARVHALWSLEGLQALEVRVIASALADPHPGVRMNAIRLAESRLETSAALREKIQALVSDSDGHVRLQVAFTVGESTQWNQAALLARLVRENSGDSWTQSAVLSSAAACSGELFALVASDPGLLASVPGADFVRQLAVVVGAQNRTVDVARSITVLAGLNDGAAVFPLVAALGEGLKRAGASLTMADARGQLNPLFERVPRLAGDLTQPEPVRRAAIDALALMPYATAAPSLLGLLTPAEAPALQAAAISALDKFPDSQVGAALLERYAGLSAPARVRVLEALLGRAERIEALWRAIENRTVRPAELTATQLSFLRKHKDAQVRERAGKLLGAGEVMARQDVYQKYLAALELTGDLTRGQSTFESRCASCHRHGGGGSEFGPNLDGVASGGKERLLTSIVDPNREVLARYFISNVETKDGESIGGILESETATTVTLHQPGGVVRTVPRARIASLKTDSRSFMPEGLEAGMSAQAMADLIGYLCGPAR